MISLKNLLQYTLMLLFSFYNDSLKPGEFLKETQVELERSLNVKSICCSFNLPGFGFQHSQQKAYSHL